MVRADRRARRKARLDDKEREATLKAEREAEYFGRLEKMTRKQLMLILDYLKMDYRQRELKAVLLEMVKGHKQLYWKIIRHDDWRPFMWSPR